MTEAWDNEGGRLVQAAKDASQVLEDFRKASGLARGSDDTYCSASPAEGHHYVSHSVQALPVRWVEICSLCGRVNGAALRAELEVTHVCGTCEQTFPDAATVNAHVAQEHRGLGEASTRELLEELRLRGDLAMVVMPTSERGADGAVFSAMAGAVLRSSVAASLDAKRGE